VKRESKNQFHITVGASIDTTPGLDLESALNVANDLRLLKAALLYADKVCFHSYGSSALTSLMNRPKKMSEKEQLEWFLSFYQDLGYPPHIDYVTNFIKGYIASRRNKRGDFRTYLKYKNALKKSLRDMDNMATKAGIQGLKAALSSDFVEFQPYARDGYSIEEYFDAISSALTSGATYPLLDDETGELVELAIQEEKIILLGTSEKRAKHVGLSSGLIERLPLFDYASVDEILDIRKELDESLVRFRAAIIKYSNTIESVPWEKEFPQEIEAIFLEYVKPAVLELEEAYKSSKSLLNIIPSALKNKGFPTLSALGLALSQTSQSETILALSMAGGFTIGAYEAVKERREQLTEVKNHQLFFYYRAGEILSSGN
jgi:hypothetical protein